MQYANVKNNISRDYYQKSCRIVKELIAIINLFCYIKYLLM